MIALTFVILRKSYYCPGYREMQIFKSLEAAAAKGYEVYDRTEDGWLVRTRIGNQFALALVVIRRDCQY